MGVRAGVKKAKTHNLNGLLHAFDFNLAKKCRNVKAGKAVLSVLA